MVMPPIVTLPTVDEPESTLAASDSKRPFSDGEGAGGISGGVPGSGEDPPDSDASKDDAEDADADSTPSIDDEDEARDGSDAAGCVTGRGDGGTGVTEGADEGGDAEEYAASCVGAEDDGAAAEEPDAPSEERCEPPEPAPVSPLPSPDVADSSRVHDEVSYVQLLRQPRLPPAKPSVVQLAEPRSDASHCSSPSLTPFPQSGSTPSAAGKSA